MHSSSKYGRDSYDSRVSSYVPGELGRSNDNLTEQVNRKENITVRSGASRSVSQQIASSGGSMLDGDKLGGDSSRSVLMETTTSRYSSQGTNDGKYGVHSAGTKPSELGFQYEDIQSFRERQKIEGDGLQLHRRRLSGNIVGTVNREDSASDNTTSDSGYSSAIAADVEKSRDGDVHRYTSSVREYKSYGTSQDDRLARDRILGDSKSSGIGSHLQSSITSHDYKSSRDGGTSSDKYLADRITDSSHLRSSITSRDSSDLLNDRYSRERMLADARSKISDKSYLSDYKTSGDIGRSRLSGVGSTSSTGMSTSSYTRSSDYKTSSSTDTAVPRDDRFSRTDALVAKYLDSSRYKSKRGSDIASEHKHLSSLTGIKEEMENGRLLGGRDITREKHHSVSGQPMSYLPIDSSYQDLLKKKKEESNISQRSSILDKIPGASSHSRYSYGDVSSKSPDISSSSAGIGRRDNLTSRMSYDWQDKRSRDQAIDRLLNKTRRYSTDSILDKTSHDKKLDDVIGAMTNKDLNSSTSHVERHVRETKYGGRPEISRPRSVDDILRESERARAMSPDERLKDQNKDVLRSRYDTLYTSLDHSHYKPTSTRYSPREVQREGIYDKLRRGSGPLESSGLDISKRDNYRGSIEGLDQPVYERLYSSSRPESRSSKGIGSPVPMSDHFGQPLDKYDKPVPLHGKDIVNGREIVSKYPDLNLERPRRGDDSDYMTDDHTNVRETTRTSVMQRSFVSRNGEVLKDEVQRHDEIRHGGQNAIEGTEGRYSSPDITTRIQRYPAVQREDEGNYELRTDYDSRKLEDVRRMRDTESLTQRDQKLDEVMKLTGLHNTGDVTNYQERTRRDNVTRIQDDSNIRTKVNRTDVNTNVNIFKEISAPKRDRPSKSGKLGIADLKSKIEALTKSVDELMDLKSKTVLKSYVKEHAERRPSSDLVEPLPKIDRYEVKSKRYEPKEIELDQVDYAYKELDLEEMPKRPEHTSVELNIKSLWLSEEQQKGKDIGLFGPKQIELAPEKRAVGWWNAATAEDADQFLCIGGWKWWNASTTEGVDQILGVQAIDKETGMAGAIIAKYEGEEQPIQWAWIEAANQPTAAEKRQTLTRVLKIDKDDLDLWDGKTSGDRTNQRMSIANMQWWDANTTEGVEQLLGIRGTNEETRTILATYDEGTKPTAWTWVQTPQTAPGVKVERNHSVRRSSRDIYVDESDSGKVELLIRVKDEETQDPRFISIRPGPVEKAIIVHKAVESELPYTKNIWEEGKQGEGLEVTDGVVQMKVQDLTPQEREAWAHIMGMEGEHFKLQENQTFEIPVKFVDTLRYRVKKTEDLYAVPTRKNKRKPLFGSTRSVKSVKEEEKKKLEERRSVDFDTRKKEKKETDSQRKKKESKRKKLEAEIKKKEEVEKKKEEAGKKKKEEMEKKKKEEKMKLEKKRESERKKEKEKERKRMEQQKKKGIGSVRKEKAVKEGKPPPVDRTNKPPSNAGEINTEETRRDSDVVDTGMGQGGEQYHLDNSKRLSHVEVSTQQYGSVPSRSSKSGSKVFGGSFSPKRTSSPFAVDGKGPTPRPQSAKARVTTYTQSQNSKTVIEEEGGNLTRQASPSVKSIQHVSVKQSKKNQPHRSEQTDSIKHKSGSLQRRSTGSSIAVPLRGGASKQTNSSVKVISNQTAQSQKQPGQNIRQTSIHESHSYRTETHIISDDGKTNAVLPHIPAMQPGLGHIGAGHADGGQVNMGAGNIGVNQGIAGQAGAGGAYGGQGHIGVESVSNGQGLVGATHIGVSQGGIGHAATEGVGLQNTGGQGHVVVESVGGGQWPGGASHLGFKQDVTGHTGAGEVGLQIVGGQGHVGSVALHDIPTESSTEYSHESGVHQLPDGSYVQKEVSHTRRTSWSVEEKPTTNDQALVRQKIWAFEREPSTKKQAHMRQTSWAVEEKTSEQEQTKF